MDKDLDSITKEEKIKFELMKAAEEELKEKFDIFSFFKSLEQITLLRKILLNESQSFMLKNTDLPIMVAFDSSRRKDFVKLKGEKIIKKKN